MKNSAARIAANNRWVRSNYDRISVTLPKGMRGEIRRIAEREGKTINSFSRDAICEAMKNRDAMKWRTIPEVKKIMFG